MTSPSGDSVSIVARIEGVIAARRDAPRESSYVAQLLADAPDAISAKLIEEAYELVHAVGDEELPAGSVLHEAADLVFHLLVLLGHADIEWADVEAELSRRFGLGGLEEQRRRRGT